MVAPQYESCILLKLFVLMRTGNWGNAENILLISVILQRNQHSSDTVSHDLGRMREEEKGLGTDWTVLYKMSGWSLK